MGATLPLPRMRCSLMSAAMRSALSGIDCVLHSLAVSGTGCEVHWRKCIGVLASWTSDQTPPYLPLSLFIVFIVDMAGHALLATMSNVTVTIYFFLNLLMWLHLSMCRDLDKSQQ